MVRDLVRGAKAQRKPNRVAHGRKRLHMEQLEGRALLAGIVDITITAGALTLTGDGSNNQVEIKQTSPGAYLISSPDETLFTLNGLNPQPQYPVAGISGNIASDLRDGNDLFRFLGVSPGVKSSVPADLLIYNSDGSNINEVIDTLVNGNLYVEKNAVSSGYSELTIRDSVVIRDTDIDNVGNGYGDTKTVVDDSHLQMYLRICNPEGNNIVDVLANSQLGTGNFIAVQPLVFIHNAAGASRTTFSGSSQVAGPGTTTVYGAVEIQNGANVVGTLNIVSFNSVNVLGYVTVLNDDGDTETMLINTTIGSHQTNPPGGILTIENYEGYDTFFMKDSFQPWGIDINNDAANAGGSTWGSSTNITNSVVGIYLNPVTDVAVRLLGDNGADSVIVQSSTIGGSLNTILYNGNNSLTLLSNQAGIGALLYAGGDGNDSVTIDNSRIQYHVYIRLGYGADRLTIRNVNYATMWPSPLMGSVDIDAELGVDTFEGVIPPHNHFDGFEFFLP